MRTQRKLLALTMALCLLIGMMPMAAFANDSTAGKAVTVSTFTTGKLSEAVAAQLSDGEEVSSITSLAVSGGALNANDFEYIRDSLTAIVELDLSGATCENNEIPLNALNNYNNNNPENSPSGSRKFKTVNLRTVPT